MATVTLDGLRKVYPDGHVAVHGASFEVADGELLVLVGPSGCGKSTLLRMIAGLEAISDGTLRIDDRVVNEVAPKDRDIAMVFQSYALYPHMTVAENLAFGLTLRDMPKAEIAARIEAVADRLELRPLLQRRPAALSLGVPQWKVTVQVLYRSALPGIVTGVLLALARISGETAPLLFTALNNQFWSTDLSGPMASVPAVIFQYAMSPFDRWHELAWAGAFIVTVFVLCTSLIARAIIARRKVAND